MNSVLTRLGILGELLQFLWRRKLYWLIPLIILLVIVALFIILGGNPVLQQFIYPFV
jgi:hypothetical protein